MELREKISLRLDNLEKMMNRNYHLENKEEVEEVVDSISKLFRILDDSERDFINVVQLALEEESEWK